MPRKRDSFDGMADLLRADPEGVMKTALVLQAIYLLPKKATPENVMKLMPEDVMKLVLAIRRDPAPFVVAAALRGAAEMALAPSRGVGRPRKPDLNAVLRRIVLRKRVDAVAYALKADRLERGKNDQALESAAAAFPVKRRETALAAMKRCRGEKKRGPLKRRAAEVVLEVLGYSATTEEGKRLLRVLQRGLAKREEKLIEPRISIVSGEPSEALLSSIAAATPKPSRSKKSPQ